MLRLSIAIVALLAAPGSLAADTSPSRARLVGAGAAMAPPAYVLSLTLHESSHALLARALGAEIKRFQLFPGFHPRTGKFYFGYVEVQGLRSAAHKRAFYAVPKLLDALLLGGYAALVASDSLPRNRYGELAIAVAASGIWVDFSRDIIAFWEHNDTLRLYTLLGLESEWQRLPARALHAGLAALASVALVRGYARIFDRGEAATGARTLWVLPLAGGSF